MEQGSPNYVQGHARAQATIEASGLPYEKAWHKRWVNSHTDVVIALTASGAGRFAPDYLRRAIAEARLALLPDDPRLVKAR